MIVGVVMIAAFLAVLLRHQKPEFAMAVGVLTGIAVLLLIISKIVPVLDTLRDMLDAAGLPGEYGQILFKALGLCLLTQLAADACRDANETAIAGRVELAGRVMIVSLCIPCIKQAMDMIARLMEGAG